MRTTKKKYLSLYEKWMKAGKMPKAGLCYIFKYDSLFKMMEPTFIDGINLAKESLPVTFWGKGSWQYRHGAFSPLRQNIVLFMAAMNNEL